MDSNEVFVKEMGEHVKEVMATSKVQRTCLNQQEERIDDVNERVT